MLIRWEPPEKEHHNGKLTEYRLRLRERLPENPQLEASPARELIIRVPLRAQERLVEALAASTEYALSIQAATQVGPGKASDEIACSTSSDGTLVFALLCLCAYSSLTCHLHRVTLYSTSIFEGDIIAS